MLDIELQARCGRHHTDPSSSPDRAGPLPLRRPGIRTVPRHGLPTRAAMRERRAAVHKPSKARTSTGWSTHIVQTKRRPLCGRPSSRATEDTGLRSTGRLIAIMKHAFGHSLLQPHRLRARATRREPATASDRAARRNWAGEAGPWNVWLEIDAGTIEQFEYGSDNHIHRAATLGHPEWSDGDLTSTINRMGSSGFNWPSTTRAVPAATSECPAKSEQRVRRATARTPGPRPT